MSFHNTTSINAISDVNEAVLAPVKPLKADQAIRATSTQSQELQQQSTPFGAAMQDSTISPTTTARIADLPARVTALESSLARQTHLNALHEAHTAKNFREQRHVNKDRRLRLQQTIKAVNDGMDEQAIETRKLGIRANSHGLQIKDVKKRVEMCAAGGEYLEGQYEEMEGRCERLQKEVQELKEEKTELQEQVQGLEEEVLVLKERDGVLEGKLKVLERAMQGGAQFGNGNVSVEKGRVLSAAGFAVGNHRLFSSFH